MNHEPRKSVCGVIVGGQRMDMNTLQTSLQLSHDFRLVSLFFLIV